MLPPADRMNPVGTEMEKRAASPSCEREKLCAAEESTVDCRSRVEPGHTLGAAVSFAMEKLWPCALTLSLPPIPAMLAAMSRMIPNVSDDSLFLCISAKRGKNYKNLV